MPLKEDGEAEAEGGAGAEGAEGPLSSRTMQTQQEAADPISAPVRPRDKVGTGKIMRDNPAQGHWAWDGSSGMMSFYR